MGLERSENVAFSLQPNSVNLKKGDEFDTVSNLLEEVALLGGPGFFEVSADSIQTPSSS